MVWPKYPAKYNKRKRMMFSRKALYRLYIVESRTQKEIGEFHEKAFGRKIERRTIGAYLRAYGIKKPEPKRNAKAKRELLYSTIMSWIRRSHWMEARDLFLSEKPGQRRTFLIKKIVRNLIKRDVLRPGERKFLRWVGKPLKKQEFYPSLSTWNLIPKELKPPTHRTTRERLKLKPVPIDWALVDRRRIELGMTKYRLCKTISMTHSDYLKRLHGICPTSFIKRARRLAKALELKDYHEVILKEKL